ncbi:MAG: hypothetical protein K8F59_09360 [Rhodobacteraceae bacterium]|nr:hypothetical protein [Paracoccaceae bacterium]
MQKYFLALAVLLAGSQPVAAADLIGNACLKSGRPGASRELCGCIQTVADLYLSRKDQKLAATFFKDPHRAQEVRQSDRRSDEAFWQRYKAFGAAAEDGCDPNNG